MWYTMHKKIASRRKSLPLTVKKTKGISSCCCCASSSISSPMGKKVARKSILMSCVVMYMPPAVTHFQKAPYSDLERIGAGRRNSIVLWLTIITYSPAFL